LALQEKEVKEQVTKFKYYIYIMLNRDRV
jgi:hypothetical protein